MAETVRKGDSSFSPAPNANSSRPRRIRRSRTSRPIFNHERGSVSQENKTKRDYDGTLDYYLCHTAMETVLRTSRLCYGSKGAGGLDHEGQELAFEIFEDWSTQWPHLLTLTLPCIVLCGSGKREGGSTVSERRRLTAFVRHLEQTVPSAL